MASKTICDDNLPFGNQKKGFMTFTKDFLIESGQSHHVSWKEKS
jgi:hypothetical protein